MTELQLNTNFLTDLKNTGNLSQRRVELLIVTVFNLWFLVGKANKHK